MKVTRKQIRNILVEGFGFSGSRFGFLGRGFGKPNSYDPYQSLREQEEPEFPEAKEDAWSGGENLEHPTDYVKTYHKLDQVREPETLDIVSERKIKMAIRKVLRNENK